jgi:murein DD-endopeptidase MepM/ murein hydrolase activator NlpD
MALNYTIQSGDTLSQIALDLGVDMRELAEANQIEDANKIRAGKKLVIPSKAEKQQTIDPVVIQKEMVQQKKAVKPKETPSVVKQKRPLKAEPILPSNVRQFFYDLAGGKETFTEKDLKEEERKALAEVVRTALNRKSTVIDYEDYQTTDKGSKFADIRKNQADSILFKIANPTYSLKTLIGAANIVEDEDGNTLVVDRYNFNDAKDFSVSEFVSGAVSAGTSLYSQARNVGKFFGSGEGQGSPVVINLGKLKA